MRYYSRYLIYSLILVLITSKSYASFGAGSMQGTISTPRDSFFGRIPGVDSNKVTKEVLELSRNHQTSKIELFNAENRHSLWKILTWDLSDDNLLLMRRVLFERKEETLTQSEV